MTAMWRRIWFALLSYIFATTVLSFVFNAMEQGLGDIGAVYQLSMLQLVVFTVAFVVFVTILCGWYMSIRYVHYRSTEGVKFGLVLMLTTLLLDVCALVVYSASNDTEGLSLPHVALLLWQPLVVIRLVILVSIPILCGYGYKFIKLIWYTSYIRKMRRR